MVGAKSNIFEIIRAGAASSSFTTKLIVIDRPSLLFSNHNVTPKGAHLTYEAGFRGKLHIVHHLIICPSYLGIFGHVVINTATMLRYVAPFLRWVGGFCVFVSGNATGHLLRCSWMSLLLT